ncbi:hypothetical protein ACFL1L_02685, partial [Thermoplasmatota archaeon]
MEICDYEITVKTIDKYGEESEWSDPLIVSTPKYRFFNGYFIKNFNFKIYSFILSHPYLNINIY